MVGSQDRLGIEQPSEGLLILSSWRYIQVVSKFCSEAIFIAKSDLEIGGIYGQK